ncbi:MAG TPA: hypothetical protein VIJ85_05065 [Rhizomicrobium sp.]
MALTLRVDAAPEVEVFPARSEPKAEPRNDIEKLAMLHDEARETAILANLLGRAPYAAAALIVLALGTLALSLGTMPIAEPATWAVLMLIGAGAILRSYMRAIGEPFERATLREFAADLNAIALYCGFAWGAGAYLAIGPHIAPLALAAFAVLPAIAIAATLRAKEIVIGFVAPVAALTAFAAVLRPLPGGPLGAAFVLIACGAVGAAIFWTARFFEPAPTAAKLADFQFS